MPPRQAGRAPSRSSNRRLRLRQRRHKVAPRPSRRYHPAQQQKAIEFDQQAFGMEARMGNPLDKHSDSQLDRRQFVAGTAASAATLATIPATIPASAEDT